MTRHNNRFVVNFIFLFVLYLELVNSQTRNKDLKEHKNWRLLDHGTSCGRRLKADRRILGGKQADRDEFPWLFNPFSIGIVRQADQSTPPKVMGSSCGGSVINDRYVLTAAHCCLTPTIATTFYVRRSGDKVSPRPELLPVEEVIKHEEYSGDEWKNDICLIRLKRPLTFSKNFQPICLPVEPEWETKELTGLLTTIAGWGYIYNESTFHAPDFLHKVELTIIPTSDCIQHWILNSDPKVVEPMKQLCAGTIEKDACQGDSGGPLMYQNTLDGTTRYFLLGLVSYGSSCKQYKSPKPGVFVKVSYYMPWILDHIHE